MRWLTTTVVGASSLMGDNGFATVVSSPAGNSVQVTPMSNAVADESTKEVLELIASGDVCNVPEDRKVSAIAGNWEQAFGVAAPAADIEYVKSLAELIEAEALAGKSCAYFDEVLDHLAQDFNNDRGRTEYAFSADVIAWVIPDAAMGVLTCLGWSGV